MGILKAVATVAAAGATLVFVVAMTDLGTAETAAPGYRDMVNLNSLRCLDVTGMSKNVGAVVHQWRCTHGKPSQSWQLVEVPEHPRSFQLRNDRSRKCLATTTPAAAPGTATPAVRPDANHDQVQIRQYDCSASGADPDSTLWEIVETGWPGYIQLRTPGGDRCLEIPGNSRKNGADTALGTCRDTANRDPAAAGQAWLLWPV